MWRIFVALVLTLPAPSQDRPQPAPARPSGAPAGGGSVNPVEFDGRGWPIVPGDMAREADPRPQSAPTPRAAPAGESAPRATPSGPRAIDSGSRRGDVAALPASGMELDSPLIDVFRATHSPAAFRDLGGVELTWRLKIHGQHGEVIGEREVRHLADCAYSERDRIEFESGRTCARVGGFVSVANQGIPSQASIDAAADELMLFGLQLRMPWCFGDGDAFAVLRRDVSERNGERLMHIVLERRPPASLDLLGPEADPAPRDRFELFCDPGTGQPRELLHRFARSLETRRVLLEDWREIDGVRLPFRRVYVDEALQPTTTVEIARLPERRRVSERDFRLAM